MASLTSEADLVSLIGRQRVVELFDDDGDGVVAGQDLNSLNDTLAEANDYAIACVLKKGWEATELDGLSGDRALRRAATQVAAMLAGQRRPGFFDPQGRAFFDALGKNGKDYLQQLARGELRSRLEDQHGANRSIRGARSTSTPSSVFGRDPNDPNDKYGDGRGF